MLDASSEDKDAAPATATMLYTCRLRENMRQLRAPLAAIFIILCIGLTILFWRSSQLEEVLRGDKAGFPQQPQSVAASEAELVYGIVLDAGSTGSRIHVFRIKRNAQPSEGHDLFELVSEEFHFVKPGLSAYARDPKKAADSLEPLIARARNSIPSNRWARTLTALRATAGLRLLSEAKAAEILAEVRVFLRTQGLSVSDDAVQIMDGEEEGILSWLTLNFMRGLLSRPSSTLGALDLGGGSTQITFLPASANTEMEAPRGFIVSYPLGERRLRLYTHSYLGLGLMAARLQMLGGGLKGKHTEVLSSSCLPPDYKGKWRYGSEEIEVRSAGLTGFQSCFAMAANLVTELHGVDWPEEARKRSFYAFSYFFDRAEDAGLFAKGSPGRLIEVREFKEAAKKVCSSSNSRKPFLCMDMCYISALFLKGYHFEPQTELYVMKRVGKVELSWGLGLMLKLLHEAEGSRKTSKDRNLSL